MNAMDSTNRRSRGVGKAATAHTRIRTLQDYGVLRTALLSRSCAACRDLAEKRTGLLQGIAELRWSYAHRPPKYLSKMAGTMRSRVTNCRGVIAVPA